MTVYVPILKGRRAEFLALRHAAPPVTSLLRPLLEVIPGGREGLLGDVLSFGDRLWEAAPKGMVFAVDCRYLDRAYAVFAVMSRFP